MSQNQNQNQSHALETERDLSTMTKQDVLKALQTDLETGLTTEEAKKRTELFGANEL